MKNYIIAILILSIFLVSGCHRDVIPYKGMLDTSDFVWCNHNQPIGYENPTYQEIGCIDYEHCNCEYTYIINSNGVYVKETKVWAIIKND